MKVKPRYNRRRTPRPAKKEAFAIGCLLKLPRKAFMDRLARAMGIKKP